MEFKECAGFHSAGHIHVCVLTHTQCRTSSPKIIHSQFKNHQVKGCGTCLLVSVQLTG